MKKIVFLSSALLLVAFVCSLMSFANGAVNEFPPKWEKLGERKVNYGLDRDEILVTAREGRFTALKFAVQKSGINMHKMVVHYGNGDTQEIELREEIPAGGESRVINLEGNRRIIRKVVFWYDTKNFADKRADLALWGRH